MDKGEIIVEGTLNELLAREEIYHVVEFSFLGSIPEPLKSRQNGLIIKWDEASGKGTCELIDVTKDIPNLFNLFEKYGLTINDFELRKPTLDDLFLRKTGRKLANITE
jgi:ABC-type multidrug transport system ATPase subunit